MGNLEKNAGHRGHNIIFFPYYLNFHAKKCTKIQLGENIWYFISQCLYFFPLRPCNNFSTLTDCVLGGKIMQEGNQIIFFPLNTIFFCENFWAEYFNWGKIYDIFSPCLYFSPCVLFFPPVSSFFPSYAMQLIVLLSQVVYWGKILVVYVFSPGHAVWYLFYISS